MPTAPNDFALVIGIQHYPDYRKLEGPVGDATRFAEWLKNKRYGGGLLPDHCKLIVSEDKKPPIPIKYQIDDAIGEIKKDAAASGARRFYFYFSGHGMGTNEVNQALCVATWSEERPGAALQYECYLKFFQTLGSFQEVVFLLDCCRVRDIAASGGCPEHGGARPSSKTGQVSTFTAFASEYGTPAYEAIIAEQEEDTTKRVRGHFTQALMEALEGGAAGMAVGVTAQRLEEHLKRRVEEIAHSHGHNQKARVISDLAKDVEMVFGSHPTEHNVEIAFDPPFGDAVQLFRSDNTVFQSGASGAEAWPLRLPAGIYCLVRASHENFFRVSGGGEVQHERY